MATGTDALTKLMAGANKKYGFPVGSLADIAVPTTWLTTDNMAINYVTGGGIPLGRITELSGLPSSGKTTTALQTAANLQKIIIAGGDEKLGIYPTDKILYLDYEQAMDPDYALSLGLDVNHESFLFGQPSSLEAGANLALEAVKTGHIRLLIVDSVATMIPDSRLAKDVGEYTVGLHAKLLTDFGNNMNVAAAEHNTAVILLNHTKEKVGMGGRPGGPPIRTTPGGVGLKYLSSIRLEYEPRKQHKSAIYDPLMGESVDQVTANDVRVKAVKNKLAPPYRQHVVRVRYGKGFDNFFTALLVLLAHKKIMHSAGMYYFHKIEEEGAAPEWMTRASTGTHRPYIKGLENLNRAAETYTDWSELLILMAETLIYEKAPEGFESEDIEEEEVTNKVSL